VSYQAVLLIVGAVAEGAGVVLIGFPDLLPGALRLSAWLRRYARIALNRLRRLVGLQPLQKHVSMSGSVSGTGTMYASVIKGVGQYAIMEEKIAFLLQRDQEAQQAVNALTRRVEDLETAMPQRLEELRMGLEAHVASELTAALEAYRPLRVAGTFALAIGLICLTSANFV
jgi:hypothetical protein